MTKILFNGGDGAVEVKTLTIHQNSEYVLYRVETMNGVIYQSPLFKRVK